MPINPKYLAELEELKVYHIYNRTNNKELLFLNDRHKQFFLNRYQEIVSPFAETFAWILLDNHFHFLIRIKSNDEITRYLQKSIEEESGLTLSEKRFLSEDIGVTELLEFTFKRFFQSYALAFNKEQNRKGNLFTRRFKRISVTTENHLRQTILYIHGNAVKHGLLKDFTRYKWSSWHSLLRGKSDFVNHKFVTGLFGGKKQFVETHREQVKKYFNYNSPIDG